MNGSTDPRRIPGPGDPSPGAPRAMERRGATRTLRCGCGHPSAGTHGIEGGDAPGVDAPGDVLRRAVAVDPEIKDRNLKRLRRIEGQVRGLQRMVEEERWCADIMTQIASVQEALRGVGRELMRNHLKHCAAQAVGSGDPARAEAMYDELLEMIYRHVR